MVCDEFGRCSKLGLDTVRELLNNEPDSGTYDRYCKDNSMECPYNPKSPVFDRVYKKYLDKVYAELHI